ncbi:MULTISPECIES: hypothetical protein [Thalassospira]|uniref:hypothetical protein n=1 Tax=Thalassospira TaxID=168934 RepID=UPI000D773C81|nr:hypothetical protein [Thalassospira sp. 11-3]MBL4839736.1 hypothetical protein [Thalassospira sp.]PXX34433.1 hypothetical protein C7967_102492 [Thalassospira sp. 11-3]
MTGDPKETDEIRNSRAAREARSIVKFMIEHTAYGGFGALVFGALVLFFDIGGIYSLAMASRDAPIFIMLLFFGLFITFGGISLGIGIMNLGGFSDNDRYEDERKSHWNDRNDGRGE